MTINAPAIVILAFFLANARDQGVDWRKLRGTIQNDILKEFHAQNEFVFPPEPSVRLVVDLIEFCTEHVPQWNVVSISGYHIREAGSTAVQELAMTLADGMHYVEQCLARGIPVDRFAPRLSFFFNAHNDLFEEVAKYRAARKVWYKVMTERFKCKNPRSAILRFHTQTAGCSLTAQQPYNNIVRVAIQALAAVLGGTQSLHTNSLDETLALPTEHAARIALRTQQILAHETGVTNTVDPLAGSYFLERLTLDMEKGCWEYFDRLDAMGGMVAAIEKGFPQREIQDASYEYQKAVERKEKIIVGVNEFGMDEEPPIDTLLIDESVTGRQVEQLRKLRETRDNGRVRQTLEALREAAATHNVNMMPSILDCVLAYTTLGEICATLRSVYGVYEEPIF